MHFPVFRKGCVRVHEYVCGLLGIESRQSLCVLGKYSTTEPGTQVLSYCKVQASLDYKVRALQRPWAVSGSVVELLATPHS